MLVWFIIVVLTGLVVLALIRPLAGGGSNGADLSGGGSLNVYRNQLNEIEADLARGIVGASEAEAARTEVSRRILAEADRLAAGPPAPVGLASSTRGALIAVACGLPALALALYGATGLPDLPGHPAVAIAAVPIRQAIAGAADLDKLLEQVEARLRQAPDDGRGWDVIAPVYLREGRFPEAKQAFGLAMELLGETPKRLLGYAESSVRAGNGAVGADARAAFEKVLKAEPGRFEPRFWLAVAREQGGDLAGAAEDYRALLADAPPDAPWRPAIVERLAVIAPSSNSASTNPTERGPTADQAASAATMTPEARQQMIAGMVDGLHQRLKADGRDAAGWQRLLRAYAVLGDVPKATLALAEARRALASDKSGLAAVDELAREMGLGS